MRLEQIARLPDVLAAALREPGRELAAVQSDSRRADGATAFYALRGATHDGHRFLEPAVAAGAPVLFVSDREAFDHWAGRAVAERAGGGPAGVFLVREGRRALAQVAGAVHGHPSRRLTLLAVTGTNGKTTATHLAAQMLERLGHRCALIGSLGLIREGQCRPSTLTTPEAPEIQAFLAGCLAEGVETVAMEASSVALATERTHGLVFRAAAYTNLTPEHLDFHHIMEAYGAAKARLFLEYEVGRAVLNLDDPAPRALVGKLEPGRLITFSLDPALAGQAALSMAGLEAGVDGMSGVLLHRTAEGETRAPFRSPLLGRYNLSNLLAATGLLLAAGHPLAALATAAESARGAPGRFERVALPHPFTVVVDYAHTPDALEHLLRAARELAARRGSGRVLLLFGCGGERDASKRPRMGAIAAALADEVVLTSDNPRGEPPGLILDQIEAGLTRRKGVRRIESRGEAIAAILESARPGDLVLIAGKGHETYQEVAGRRIPFDDRQVVREWAAATGHPA